MEILKVGDKIKRLRIFKGLKLKELKTSKLSVSKISSIENNKIIPDEVSIRILANKLGTTYEYLNRSVDEEINERLKILDIYNGGFSSYKEILLVSVNNKLYDMGAYICNKIFNKFINKDSNFNHNIFNIMDIYLECIMESNKRDSINMYYLDLSLYLFSRGNYKEALNYFYLLKNVNTRKFNINNREIFLKELECYLYLGEYEYINKNREDIVKCINNYGDSKFINDFKQFKIILNIIYCYSKDYIKSFRELINSSPLHNKLKYMYNVCYALYYNSHMREILKICFDMYYLIHKNYDFMGENKGNVYVYLSFIYKVFIENSILHNIDDIINKLFKLACDLNDKIKINECYLKRVSYYTNNNDIDNLKKYLDIMMKDKDLILKLSDYDKIIIDGIFLIYLHKGIKEALLYSDLLLK